MNRQRVSGALILSILGLSAWGMTAFGDHHEKGEKAPSPEEMKKAWIEFSKPGEAHELLKAVVGKWKAEVKSYYPGVEEPEVSQGSAEFKSIMDGRYVQQTFKGTFDGEEFEGRGVHGFDNGKKKFVSTWIDSMSTGIIVCEGEFDEAQGSLVEIGKMATPNGEEKVKYVWQYIPDTELLLTMYAFQGEQEMKMMEITYTRQ